MRKVENRAHEMVGLTAGIYLLGCSFASIYFNYEYRERGFVSWVMFGEVVATIKGLVWPYYAVKWWHAARLMPRRLGEGELDRFAAIGRNLSLSVPEIMAHDLAEARAILQNYRERTGSRLTSAAFQDQVGWASLDIEFKAELTEAMLLSWDRQVPTTTARLVELESLLPKYGDADEVDMGNELIVASAKRQALISYNGRQVPIQRAEMPEIERRFRRMLASFNTLTGNLSDLLE